MVTWCPAQPLVSPLAADVQVFEPRVPPGGLDVPTRVEFDPVNNGPSGLFRHKVAGIN